MSLADGERPGPDLASCIRARPDGTHDIGFVTVQSGSRDVPSWSHVTSLTDHREIRLISEPPRTHLLALTATPDKRDQLVWTWGVGGE